MPTAPTVNLKAIRGTKWVSTARVHPGAVVEVLYETASKVVFKYDRQATKNNGGNSPGGSDKPKSLDRLSFYAHYKPYTTRDYRISSGEAKDVDLPEPPKPSQAVIEATEEYLAKRAGLQPWLNGQIEAVPAPEVSLPATTEEYTKRCARCGQYSPRSNFGVDRSAKDGRYSWCKPCAREYDRARDAKRREQRRAGKALVAAAPVEPASAEAATPVEEPYGLVPEKLCPRCEQTKPARAFALFKGNKQTGLQSWCKDCINESGKLRRKAQQEATVPLTTTSSTLIEAARAQKAASAPEPTPEPQEPPQAKPEPLVANVADATRQQWTVTVVEMMPVERTLVVQGTDALDALAAAGHAAPNGRVISLREGASN